MLWQVRAHDWFVARSAWRFAEKSWEYVFPRKTTYTRTLLVLSFARAGLCVLLAACSMGVHRATPGGDPVLVSLWFVIALATASAIVLSASLDDGSELRSSSKGQRNRSFEATTWWAISVSTVAQSFAIHAVTNFLTGKGPQVASAAGHALLNGLLHGSIITLAVLLLRAQWLDVRARISHRNSTAFGNWSDTNHLAFLARAQQRPLSLPEPSLLSKAALAHYAAYCDGRAAIRRSCGELVLLFSGGGLGLSLSYLIAEGDSRQPETVSGAESSDVGSLGDGISQLLLPVSSWHPAWYFAFGALFVGSWGARLLAIEARRWDDYARSYRAST